MHTGMHAWHQGAGPRAEGLAGYGMGWALAWEV